MNMKNKSTLKCKLVGLRKSTLAKLIASRNQIQGGAVQRFALIDDLEDPKEFAEESLDY